MLDKDDWLTRCPAQGDYLHKVWQNLKAEKSGGFSESLYEGTISPVAFNLCWSYFQSVYVSLGGFFLALNVALTMIR